MATPENTKLCDFTSTNNIDFIYTPIAPPAPEAAFYEIKPALLNLAMKEHFLELALKMLLLISIILLSYVRCKKYRDIDSDIIKLKLFPFSLRGRAKNWLLSLPTNSMDS